MHYAYIATAILLCLGALRGFLWYRYWKAESAKLLKDSYLPHQPSATAKTCYQGLTRGLHRKMVGSLIVEGLENVPQDACVMQAPNHQYQMDFGCVLRALPYGMRDFRYIAVSSELLGLRGLLGAWTGAYGVDNDLMKELRNPNNKDGTLKTEAQHQADLAEAHRMAECCISASILALTGTPLSQLLYFPQGKLIIDDKLLIKEFKTGAVRIAYAASKIRKTYIQPIGIDYIWDAEHALCKGRKAFGKTNYGVVVVFGTPIDASTLPLDANGELDVDASTLIVRDAIADAFKRAREIKLSGGKQRSATTPALA